MTAPSALRIDYFSDVRQYKIMKYEDDLPVVLCEVSSSLKLIGYITSFLLENPKTPYELSYHPSAWKSLNQEERTILDDIVALHTNTVHQRNQP